MRDLLLPCLLSVAGSCGLGRWEGWERACGSKTPVIAPAPCWKEEI